MLLRIDGIVSLFRFYAFVKLKLCTVIVNKMLCDICVQKIFMKIKD